MASLTLVDYWWASLCRDIGWAFQIKSPPRMAIEQGTRFIWSGVDLSPLWFLWLTQIEGRLVDVCLWGLSVHTRFLEHFSEVIIIYYLLVLLLGFKTFKLWFLVVFSLHFKVSKRRHRLSNHLMFSLLVKRSLNLVNIYVSYRLFETYYVCR